MTRWQEAAFHLKAATVRRRVGAYYRQLRANQSLPPEESARLTARMARGIAEHARSQSPFYRELYRDVDTAGLDPAGASWLDLPILDRSTVKENSGRISTLPPGHRHAREALTGGSTGQPLRTQHDARVATIALSWRMYSWWGVQPWDNLARIGRWNFGRVATIKNDISWWPTRQRYLDAGLISPESMAVFADELEATRPALLEGYVGATLEFARYLESQGRRIPGLRAVATTAAPLPPSTRHRLEDVFGVPVYDEYRGSEVSWMAGECSRREGLHIFSDARLIEVIGDDGRPVPDGEIGDLVVTDLTNRAFPLIRYRLGDRGSLLPGLCECGVTLPRMQQPDGRTTDLIRLPSGRSLGHRLMAMFAAHPEAVHVFQIHQSADYAITVRVVKGSDVQAERHIETAVEALRDRIDREVPVSVVYVDDIEAPRGKVKYVVSEVAAT